MMVVILLVFIGIFNGLINLLLAPRSRVPKGAGIHEKTEETKCASRWKSRRWAKRAPAWF